MNNNTHMMTRKVVICPVGDTEEVDRVYQYLREGMKNQNRAMNEYMTALYVAMMQESGKDVTDSLKKLYQRVPTAKEGSAYTEDHAFAVGLGTPSAVSKRVREDFESDVKKGLKYGKRSVRNYREDNPLIVQPIYIRLREINERAKHPCHTGIYHNYASHSEMLDHLYKEDFEAFIRFCNNITFRIVFGNPRKSSELRNVFEHIFDTTYNVCGSTIEIARNGKIILNFFTNKTLSISVGIQRKKLKLLRTN